MLNTVPLLELAWFHLLFLITIKWVSAFIQIWCTDEDSDPEAAKLLLESVMATELFSNNQDTFIKLVNKVTLT